VLPTPLGNLPDLHLPAAPQRVVSLVPSVTGSLFDLGLGQRVVGVTDYCVYPPAAVAALPKVGGTKNPDTAQVLGLRPDLVVANWEENQRETVDTLRAAGVPVWVTFPRTVRDALDMLWALIALMEAPQAGRALDALEKSVEWASAAADSTPPARVFCPIWREPATTEGPAGWWMTINRDTYVHDVLRLCGGENVFANRDRRYPLAADLDPAGSAAAPIDPPALGRDTRYPRVTTDEVLARAPDVILLPSEPYPFAEADLAAFDPHPALPAVQTGRIHLVDGSALTWPGTRLALALAELPALLGTA
jgi:ABC-type Fe3+-hydroxamate transport system substrate-binding protein